MLKDYKVDLCDKSQEIAERINKQKIYTEFVKSQEEGFMRFITYINLVVDKLKQKAKISPFIEIRARIKDADSALKNHSDDRLLDDVFGVEIITANEHEINTIKQELEKTLKSTRSKKHNKENGYKAEHESYSIKSNKTDDNINKFDLNNYDVPAVECQFKTIEVELNPKATHHDYKQINRQIIQEKLENETLQIGKEIPRMWVSRESGIIELSYKEILQRIYPFVDITRIKEPEKEEKMK